MERGTLQIDDSYVLVFSIITEDVQYVCVQSGSFDPEVLQSFLSINACSFSKQRYHIYHSSVRFQKQKKNL